MDYEESEHDPEAVVDCTASTVLALYLNPESALYDAAHGYSGKPVDWVIYKDLVFSAK